MPRIALDPAKSLLAVVDLQTALVPQLADSERILNRAAFLAKAAQALEVPILATEQNPDRMGATDPALAGIVGSAISKMAFGAADVPAFSDALRASGRNQVVIVGCETHICVSLTAQALLDAGYEVVVCPDAVGARSMERHKLGMERIRDAGVVPAHTESVAYEWLRTAEHPRFREVLAIVKAHADA